MRAKMRRWHTGCLDRVKVPGPRRGFSSASQHLWPREGASPLRGMVASLGFEPRQRNFTYETPGSQNTIPCHQSEQQPMLPACRNRLALELGDQTPTTRPIAKEC